MLDQSCFQLRTKKDYGRGQFLNDFDDFGFVEELTFRAFQQHPNTLRIDAVLNHNLNAYADTCSFDGMATIPATEHLVVGRRRGFVSA